jgi:hypothetical protein
VSALETQKARAPSALAFRAAQIVLGTRALFSDQLLRNLLDPPTKGARAASEAHHLFPTAWLQARGIRDRRRTNQIANLADVGWYENSDIGGRGPSEYVPRLRKKLEIDDDRGVASAQSTPFLWGGKRWSMRSFSENGGEEWRTIGVAYRQLGGEQNSPPLTPPWFLAGAEAVWGRITETERALRAVVRDVYAGRFGDGAGLRIQQALPERDQEVLVRALRTRPPGSDPLNVVDYLYLGQLPSLLFASDAWQDARLRFGGGVDAKQKLQSAVALIAPVRNEIAHVREVERDRLLRASVACSDVLGMLQSKP